MKTILFCMNPYAFGILKPLHDELIKRGDEILWYIPERIQSTFPYRPGSSVTAKIKDIDDFKSDAIFVPGNEVPHYLRGVKVQIFHGLAGEKKGHFRVRNYFDLYLTQGPYFTKRFQELSRKYKDFEVIETGWCKLDPLFKDHDLYKNERDSLLLNHNKKNLVLFAPTFSPALTCSINAKDEIFKLADNEDIFLLIKFHDLMNPQVAQEYKEMADLRSNVQVVADKNILKYMIMSDFMISDTSSVVYEFILLNKPVITINSHSENINWCDISNHENLHETSIKELKEDNFKDVRQSTIDQYHPYTDGNSSVRMIDAVTDYINRNGVPEQRKINLYRRYKMNKMFGKEPK
jgi:CDP-ribitol ribitolphosphotransferase / teichoic acid ribitol-phosphate polymerase